MLLFSVLDMDAEPCSVSGLLSSSLCSVPENDENNETLPKHFHILYICKHVSLKASLKEDIALSTKLKYIDIALGSLASQLSTKRSAARLCVQNAVTTTAECRAQLWAHNRRVLHPCIAPIVPIEAFVVAAPGPEPIDVAERLHRGLRDKLQIGYEPRIPHRVTPAHTTVCPRPVRPAPA